MLSLRKPESIKYRQVLIGGAVIAVAALASLSILATGPAATPSTPVEKAWPVSVITSIPASLQPDFSAYGKVESSQVAALRSELIAQVRRVHVKEGDWVEAGQLLLELDDREARLEWQQRQAELQQHQANLRSAQLALQLEQRNAPLHTARYQVAAAKMQRHTDLLEKRLIARSAYDEINSQTNQATIDYQTHQRTLAQLPQEIALHRASIMRAEALVQQAAIKLEKATIRAPFAGPVLQVDVAAGNLSSLTLPLLTLADAEGFELRVQIPDQHIPLFSAALSNPSHPLISARSASGQHLHLARTAAHVRSGQTGMDAFFAFTIDNQSLQQALPPLGQTLHTTITLPAQDNLIALPIQSIYDNQRIYAVQDNRLVAHDIERVGERHNPAVGFEVLVRSPGLQPGAAVITTQLPKAIGGLLVQVAN
ncbi:MAG: biotin/lipoyl-binding protein [Pseudomonadota bacterium]